MLILYFILAYLFIGVVFAIVFLSLLIQRLDEASEGTSWGFKLMIFPGCVIFWPLLLQKYLRASKDNGHD
jgi:hypothetical protein